MPNSTGLALLIRGLYDADPARRASAAAEIFQRGRELARAATQSWLADAQLAACLVRGRNGLAEVTVGVAVEPDTFERIRTASGMPRLADVPPDQDAQEFELEFSNGARLDVLTTRQPGGPGAIARYLQKFGEGIQQVEIAASDVDRATGILRARFGLEPVYPATRAGADGTRVNFFLVPAPDNKKILIEIVEPSVKS
ncbi:MAG TPA: hypothetical protein VN822_10950 [Candidatus Acidoferrales bacterium]|nr:hypothetical protein [Candidatus Acidoferrales bacterium]